MDVTEIFDHLSSKIGQLLFGRTAGDRNVISKTLDDLNSLNYRYPVVRSPTKAALLVNQCCSFIPPDDAVLVSKGAQLMANLLNSQNIVIEGRTLLISVQWCCQAIKINDQNVVLDILKAIKGLLRNNAHNVPMLLDSVTKDLLYQIEEVNNVKPSQVTQEILLSVLQCLEATTVFSKELKSLNFTRLFPHFEKCAQIFISFLCVKECTEKSPVQTKILETCLLGLQNIIILHPIHLQKELGLILGIIKTYMLYGVKHIEFVVPEKLLPSTLGIPEIPCTVVREKTGGKVTKQRKHRTAGSNSKKKDKKNSEDVSMDNGYIPATTSLDYNSDSGLGHSSGLDSRLKTSDSDFSDNEGGKLAKLSHCCNKVRQAALNLFYNVIKYTEKSTIFLYWSSFVPESCSLGKHNLVTCVLKEPSMRGKMCALNVLLLLLTSSKMYLTQAESSDKTSSFTPFCVALGLTLTELHKNLCLGLNQVSVPVLTQVLKCLAALVQATPYHRMGNGLITKIIRNVKVLVYHKDASVQVTALIVTGCILAFEPAVPETIQVMNKVQKEEEQNPNKSVTVEVQSPNESLACDNFDYAQFSSDDEENEPTVIEIDSVPWLLQKCLSNLGVTFETSVKKETVEKIVPAPVKLESLQVLSAMTRNYFESLILPHLNYIVKALEISLTDNYADLRLHAGRAVDFFGQAMARIAENKGSSLCLNFWQTLLNGPLVSLLQNEQHATLRAVGCDCLGSIGPHIFQQLPREKQILCVTLLFACSKDEENTVRGAAVRALALCVLYPSLREDPGFVVDTADAILEALKDTTLTVRVKASWSLGNLSDALVLNSKCDETPDDKLPEKVLLKLLEASIRSSLDSDKIKMNVVRAIGNLVQLVDTRLLKDDGFKNACEQALNALVKGSTTGTNMKVRWNACYALGKALNNSALYGGLDANLWQASVFNKLSDLVVGFKNFKVRINAALALSSPAAREHYGPYFIPIWTALLKALENSENVDDFTEYKHRDHLIEQICLSLGHLTTLLSKEDLPLLENILNLYLDIFKTHMHKVLERLVPEKSTELFAAACCLNAMESRSDIDGAGEKRVVACLKSIFVLQF